MPEEMLSHRWLKGVMKEEVDMALWLQKIWGWRKPWPRKHEGQLTGQLYNFPRLTSTTVTSRSYSATDAETRRSRVMTSAGQLNIVTLLVKSTDGRSYSSRL